MTIKERRIEINKQINNLRNELLSLKNICTHPNLQGRRVRYSGLKIVETYCPDCGNFDSVYPDNPKYQTLYDKFKEPVRFTED